MIELNFPSGDFVKLIVEPTGGDENPTHPRFV